MKNIFEYADKELSQDAFLRCLFASHEDEEIKSILYTFLKNYCSFKEEELIKNVWLFHQWHKIDIAIWMETTHRESVALFIEDKTFSNEHKQLARYNDYIDNRKEEENRYKVYYKTNKITTEDQKGIDDANKKSNIPWQICDINSIVEIFKCCDNSNNIVLKWYIEYTRNIKQALDYFKKPDTNNGKLDYIRWQSYFENQIKPKLYLDETKYRCWVDMAGRYPYVCLKVQKGSLPYLEIRSRDCCGEKFRSLILGYVDDVEKFLSQNRESLREKMELYNDFTPQKYPKKLGELVKENVSPDEFLNLVKKSVSGYIKIMEDF